MLKRLKEIYWVLTTQFGVQPSRTLKTFRGIPGFIADFRKFKKSYDGEMQLMPFLHDRGQQGGDIRSEYFLQDLDVARRIFLRNPVKHVDVGSRVDGFVAHVASFRAIEVIDIRPIVGEVSGIEFKQADLMDMASSPAEYCDSLSCLHALEHFGLGRYGDKIDPAGWRLGLSGLARMIARGGTLYLSVPIGRERVVFNANHVFSPVNLADAANAFGLSLVGFSWVSGGKINASRDFAGDLLARASDDYSLGIFEFVKD